MAISTYSELVASVANWLVRDDLTSRIPDFVTLAEAKLNRELRYFGREKRSSISVNTAATEPQYISLPDDFYAARRVYLPDETGKPRLEFVDQIRASEYSAIYTSAAQPRYYSVFGDEMELIPTPDDSYRVEMVYRALIPALSDSSPTNWLLTIAPDAYLYGALMEAAPYMMNDDRVAVWAAGLKIVIDGLNATEIGVS